MRARVEERAGALVLGVLLVAMIAVLAPVRARAGDIEDFEIARQAYEQRDFSRAVFYFEQLVGGDVPRLSSPALVAEARKYLGAAYVFVGRREAAREQFERLLREQPTYVLDPLLFPLEVQELFASVRDRLELERREAEARAAVEARAARERERAERLLAFAEEEIRLELPNSRWLALVPFGVGQFQNGDDPLGWTFLLSETAFAGAAIGALIWHQELSAQVARAQTVGDIDAVQEGNRLLEIAFGIHWAGLGALAAFAIAGIAEAQIRFVPTRVVTQRRRAPEELREELDTDRDAIQEANPTVSDLHIGLGIGGLSLSFSF
ncbi:tetratricopeptide repeat protein [Sandaracinus amylolyticus]|uniref:tetratricopeptide repeat protein n=1 Tax=Sandaracinus amylolyticus TaxID=927083 RepID=UPI001F47F8CE|nr:hypothetical protein [Sandaracinus amylolyticus]UJR85945.1 Hypothetical protein I5071_80260 [Sandaracinus amylolyticus]